MMTPSKRIVNSGKDSSPAKAAAVIVLPVPGGPPGLCEFPDEILQSGSAPPQVGPIPKRVPLLMSVSDPWRTLRSWLLLTLEPAQRQL